MHLLLGQVDFSIVDATPEELVLAQAWGVRAEYDYNCGAASRFKRVALTVETFKVRPPLHSRRLRSHSGVAWLTVRVVAAGGRPAVEQPAARGAVSAALG